jgi:simple sugar transport system permease protein
MGVILGFIASAIILQAAGFNALRAFEALLYGSFGSLYNATELFVKAAPILLIALGTAIAFKAGVWNLGFEGQLFMGALCSTWIALLVPRTIINIIPLLVIFAMLGGAAWAIIPGILKVKFKANEMVTTLMLNYVGIYIVQTILRTGPTTIRDPTLLFFASYPVPGTARYPYLIPGTRLHAGVIVAFVFALVVYVLLMKTPIGLQIKIFGCNPRAARYAGINTDRIILIVMAMSGALAGLAGMGEVCGVFSRLQLGISAGYGFFGILVAVMGRLDPRGIILTSLLFAVLYNGSESMQRMAGVNIYFAYVIMGLIVVSTLALELLSGKR